ncbi:MAG: hypothetical protein WCT47_01505 [Betaproteobacteria bacterium]|jgi:hypothetical protein
MPSSTPERQASQRHLGPHVLTHLSMLRVGWPPLHDGCAGLRQVMMR